MTTLKSSSNSGEPVNFLNFNGFRLVDGSIDGTANSAMDDAMDGSEGVILFRLRSVFSFFGAVLVAAVGALVVVVFVGAPVVGVVTKTSSNLSGFPTTEVSVDGTAIDDGVDGRGGAILFG